MGDSNQDRNFPDFAKLVAVRGSTIEYDLFIRRAQDC